MPFDYESHDAIGLAALVRDGEATAEQLLECALERSAKRNPELNAIPIPMEEEARRTIDAGLPDGALERVHDAPGKRRQRLMRLCSDRSSADAEGLVRREKRVKSAFRHARSFMNSR